MSGRSGRQDASWDSLLSRYAHTLLWADKLMDGTADMDVIVREIRVKQPAVEGGEFMCIVKGWAGNRPVVLFNSASTASEAIAGAINKARAGDATAWRDDKPYGG